MKDYTLKLEKMAEISAKLNDGTLSPEEKATWQTKSDRIMNEALLMSLRHRVNLSNPLRKMMPRRSGLPAWGKAGWSSAREI